ncbi:MAG: phosphotransferase family protein [Oscillospiraceae bacterium]|jgi:thiamine kinase-like enzyme|nr:phosphotransferase family protein [Oscillospiraceae bacterium]
MRELEQILPEIALFRGKEVTAAPLSGGLTNTTYKVTAGGTPYVLRINGHQNDFLRLDRSEEAAATRKANALGIAPAVLEDSPEYLITEFKPGRMLTRLKVHMPEFIRKIAAILRLAHTVTGVGRDCSPFYLAEQYLDGARRLGLEFPDGLNACLREVERIQTRAARAAGYTRRYCHNDVYTINILEHNGELCLIDWELSGMGSVFFDLATVSSVNHFSDEEDALLLEEYFGAVEGEHTELLRDMKVMNMLREVAWALLHHAMQTKSPNPQFDYYKNAVRFLNRLKDGYVTG